MSATWLRRSWNCEDDHSKEVQVILQKYLSHLSDLAGGMVNCGSVLSWMEMDNRGHRLVATDDSGINTPAIAAAHVIKRYNAQAADEISLQVGDMISVIDMPPAEDTIWWRGKRGFEVGFFPSECVEVIGDKVPSSMASRVPEPINTSSSSQSSSTSCTAATSRKPCETLSTSATTTTTITTSPIPHTTHALSSSQVSQINDTPSPSLTSSTAALLSSSSSTSSGLQDSTEFSAGINASAAASYPHPPHHTSSLSSSSSTATSTKSSVSSSATPSPSPSRASSSGAGPTSVPLFSLSLSAHEGVSRSPSSSPAMMRKHGKLMSFLRTFFSHRPPRHQLKQSGIVKERVFGCDLGEHLLNSGHDVPLVLKSCTDIIEEYGIVHGIYRLSGITSNIQKLRLAFDEDRVPDLTEECYLQDIHSISSLLKMYFRELPNPLLTYQLYDKFAAAVRDEDNKLLRIHDVVQQLPPPHYRTTEYLMRHLARVAAYGHETEMRSKNLAIVWAPNLLRSKELEAGGGAAALQGVGIQAVVTECLICYCDIIFSDKMPNYSGPDSSSQKKPRPKSLAISTPTRLLSLEEARERAFIGNVANLAPKKFIEVGGGPKNLPSKYHTVIDLPGYKKKVTSSSKENKPSGGSKKSSNTNSSGSGGWKSIFSKPRGGSVKKARKASQDSVSTVGPISQAKAITEEDVHNWKLHHLRTSKSAESLFTPSAGASPSGSSLVSISSAANASPKPLVTRTYDGGIPVDRAMAGRRDGKGANRAQYHLSHKRSLSSDASTVLKSKQVYNQANRNAELASPTLDVDDDQSPGHFTRMESKRKAVQRRIPSAPSTPRQDRRPPPHSGSPAATRGDHHDELDMDISLDDLEEHIYPKSESRGDVNIDAAIKSRLVQVAERQRSIKSSEELSAGSSTLSSSSPLKRGAETPLQGRKKAKADGQQTLSSPCEDTIEQWLPGRTFSAGAHSLDGRRVHRSSSDVSGNRLAGSSPYDNDANDNATEDREQRMRLFYSRFHDYAEILSLHDIKGTAATKSGMEGHDLDISRSSSQATPGSMSVSSSGCNMQDVLDQIDSRLAITAKLFPRHLPLSQEAGQRQAEHRLSNGVCTEDEKKDSLMPSSTSPLPFSNSATPTGVNTDTRSSLPSSDPGRDLSLKLNSPLSSQQTQSQHHVPSSSSSSSSSSSRQTEFPATLNTSPRELISKETMRRLLGLETPPDNEGSVVESACVSDNNSPLAGSQDTGRRVIHTPSSGSVKDSSQVTGQDISSTRVVRRRAEFIPSASASGHNIENLSDLLDSLERQEPRARRRSSRRKNNNSGRVAGGSSYSSSSSSSARPSPAGSNLHSPHISSPGHHHQHQHHHSIQQQQGGSNRNSPHLSRNSPRGENGNPTTFERDLQERLGFASAAGPQTHGPMGIPPSGVMTKCLSVPSDIAKSLENVTGSQTDMLSSVTISELSASMTSFTNSAAIGNGMDAGGGFIPREQGLEWESFRRDLIPQPGTDPRSDPIHRRSSSLDSLTDADRLLTTRTLRDINRQMEAAFRRDASPPFQGAPVGRRGYGEDDVSLTSHASQHRLAASDLDLSSGKGSKSPTQALLYKDDTDRKVSPALDIAKPTDDGQWVSTESIGQFQVSDQSLTPTQAGFDEAFKLFALETAGVHGEQGYSSEGTREMFSEESQSRTESPLVSRGSLGFTISSQEVMSSAESSSQDRLPPTRLSDQPCVEKQTYHHYDDQIVVESPQLARANKLANSQMASENATSPGAHQRERHHQHHHSHPHHHHSNHVSSSIAPSGAREALASMCVNRTSLSSTSSSSEEFDEVASPEEDEGQEGVADREAGYSKGRSGAPRRESLTLPVGNLAGGRDGAPSSVVNSVPSQGLFQSLTDSSALAAVVRRQHSPRSPVSCQGSPWDHSTRFGDSLAAGVEAMNRSWELDKDAAERMSSVFAAGFASQRARLSRESSNSSLQQASSPDSSLARIAVGQARSPLATPVREALPDLIQSTTTSQNAAIPGSRDWPPSSTLVSEEVDRYQRENSNSSTSSGGSNNLAAVQLALYHPDEFSMDIPAAVSGASSSGHPQIHPSPSLPQVGSTQQDNRPPMLRKSSTDGTISSFITTTPPRSPRRLPPPQHAPSTAASSIPSSSSADLQVVSGNVRIPTSLSMDSASCYERGAGGRPLCRSESTPTSPATFRGRAASDSRSVRAAAAQLQMERYRENLRAAEEEDTRGMKQQHVAMEVDNLCSRLVENMASPRSRRPPSGGHMITSPRLGQKGKDMSEGMMDVEMLSFPHTEISGSFSSPSTPAERGVARSLSTGSAVGLSQVSGIRDIKRGRDAKANNNDASERTVTSLKQDSELGEKRRDSFTSSSAESGIPQRKTSFSKIPRPRPSIDLTSQRPVVSGGSLKRGECASSSNSSPLQPSSLSSSIHADFSPSSSITSTSSSPTTTTVPSPRQPVSTRRGSEAGASSGKRSANSRRSSDTKVLPSSQRTSSSPSATRPQPSPTPSTSSSSSSFSRSSSGGSGRGRQNLEAKTQSQSSSSPSSSRIPLSHRVPSPQSSDSSPNLALPRQQQSKTKSPTPKPRKSSFTTKSQNPSSESTDSKQPSRRDTTVRGSGNSKTSSSSGGSGVKKSVVVKPMADDTGAKLVIETQPGLRKKVQTVHAKKVTQPPRQVAEGITGNDGQTPAVSRDKTLSSQKSSSADKPTSSAQSQSSAKGSVSFSGDTLVPPASPDSSSSASSSNTKKVPPPVAKRKFRYDSRSLPRRPKQTESNSSFSNGGRDVEASSEANNLLQNSSAMAADSLSAAEYADMVGSRSSLDESVLQLAADRQEDLLTPEERAHYQQQHNYGSSTGSLRARRSVRLQSLLDVFEQKDSDSNPSDSPCGSPRINPRTRTFSGSSLGGSLAPCVETGDQAEDVADMSMEDDAFLSNSFDNPPDPNVQLSSSLPAQRHSRQQSRDAGSTWQPAGNLDTVGDSLDLKAPPSVMTRSMPGPGGFVSPGEQRRTRASSGDRQGSGDKSSRRHQPTASSVEGEAMLPRYNRSVSGPPKSKEAADMESKREISPLSPPASPKKVNVERRNSIKDLLQVFERQDSATSSPADNSNSAPRAGSGSPSSRRQNMEVTQSPGSPSTRFNHRNQLAESPQLPQHHQPQPVERIPSNMRLSLEIPSTSDVSLPSGPLSGPLPHHDVKTQSVRLGPKPFYGAHK